MASGDVDIASLKVVIASVKVVIGDVLFDLLQNVLYKFSNFQTFSYSIL